MIMLAPAENRRPAPAWAGHCRRSASSGLASVSPSRKINNSPAADCSARIRRGGPALVRFEPNVPQRPFSRLGLDQGRRPVARAVVDNDHLGRRGPGPSTYSPGR